jgi:hypothetical protein
MNVDEAKAAILKRLCDDYKHYGRGSSLAVSQIRKELDIPGEVFGDAMNDLVLKHIALEHVPERPTHVRLTEAGILNCS